MIRENTWRGKLFVLAGKNFHDKIIFEQVSFKRHILIVKMKRITNLRGIDKHLTIPLSVHLMNFHTWKCNLSFNCRIMFALRSPFFSSMPMRRHSLNLCWWRSRTRLLCRSGRKNVLKLLHSGSGKMWLTNFDNLSFPGRAKGRMINQKS